MPFSKRLAAGIGCRNSVFEMFLCLSATVNTVLFVSAVLMDSYVRNIFLRKKDNANLKNGERRESHSLIDNTIQTTSFKAYRDNREMCAV